MAHPVPTEIKLHQKSRILETSFDDGARFELPCEYLRIFSTSAEVQAAQERGEIITGKENVNISKIEPVGSYAINIHFDDGHDTGIFAWSTLYQLGQNYDKNWQDYLRKRSNAGFGVYTVPDTGTAAQGGTKSVTILYFISLVTRLGRESETLDIPDTNDTVGDLLAWLRQRGSTWQSLLQEDKINVTVNKKFARMDTAIESNDEIAIIPVSTI